MKKIRIICGEDAELEEVFIKKNAILVYPFIVEDNGILRSEFYNQIIPPKTSQPSIGYFKKLFLKELQKYDQLIIFCVSSKLSGCYNSALQAKKDLLEKDKKKIIIIDSQSTTIGESFMIKFAVNFLQSDTNILKIEEKIKEISKQIHVFGTFESASWLKAGGRISPVKAMIADQMIKMGIRPIIELENGEVISSKIKVASKDKVATLVNFLKSETEIYKKDLINVMIGYTSDEKEAKKLMKKIKGEIKYCNVESLHILSPVIGAHLGPGAIMVSWMYNQSI